MTLARYCGHSTSKVIAMDEALAVFGALTLIGVVFGLICYSGLSALRKAQSRQGKRRP